MITLFTMTFPMFLFSLFLGMAVVFCIGMLIIIRQHRNKDSAKVVKFDDSEDFYFIDEDY